MELKQSYFELYGDNDITRYRWDQLQEIIAGAKAARSPELKKQDKGGNQWYMSEKMVGMMLYVDKFSEDLKKFESKIDYLCDLDDKSYFDIIYSLIHKLSAENGIIYFNRADTKRLPKDIDKKFLSIGIDAKIGDAPVQIRGGFIFKNSDIEDNMSFEALLSEKKDEVEDLINRCLFKNQGG